MLEYIIIGGGFALAAAIQPGPLQAYLLSSVLQKGWQRTLPAAFAPVVSDGPIALLTLFVITRLPDWMNVVLQGAGGIFLIYLAWRSFAQWKSSAQIDSDTSDSLPRTLLQAAMVNVLSPNPYLGWSLVLGPAFLEAWGKSPANAAALIIAFYATIVIATGGVILLFGTTRFLGPRGRRTLILVSAIILGLLGVYRLVASIMKSVSA
ncbi:MAG: LysE family transporter [Chloroflexi bacterium]|nr:LysE family transporter [Chloroflexota bacterium]